MFIRNRKGFTLVEIMIVVAIIGLLVAIAIPNLLRARISANESAAKGSMRTLITALENYRADQNPPTYPDTLARLSAATPPYVEPQLAGGTKQGYGFTYYTATAIVIAGDNVIPAYSISAMPQDASGTTGHTLYYTNSSGIIYSQTLAASPYNAGAPTAYTADAPATFEPIGS